MASKFILSRFLAIFLVLSVLAPVSGRAGGTPINDPNPFHTAGVPVMNQDELRKSGWRTTRPPYPYAARARNEQGKVWVKLTTDATGRVVKAETPKMTNHPDLDQVSKHCTQTEWHGPPNVTVITFLEFTIG